MPTKQLATSSIRPNLTLVCNRWLGREYIVGEYDCWHFLRDFYKHEMRIDLPAVGIDPTNARAVIREFRASTIRTLFGRVVNPMTFDAVEITIGQFPSHCGIYLDTEDGPRILHNRQGLGVVCQEPKQLRVNRLTFWRYHG